MRYPKKLWIVVFAAVLMFFCPDSLRSQAVHVSGVLPVALQLKPPPTSEGMADMQREQMRMQQADRQKKMLEDTNRLLMLAQQLKDSIDKTNKDTLSIEVLKQTEQIEHLAKSVRERMKN